MRSRLAAFVLCLFSPVFLFAQSDTTAPAQESQGTKELTIESIFRDAAILGRAPESIQWSPDGSKVSFIQRDDSDDRGSLYFVDVSTGRRAVLVASEKLTTLAPPTSAIKDERKREDRKSVV